MLRPTIFHWHAHSPTRTGYLKCTQWLSRPQAPRERLFSVTSSTSPTLGDSGIVRNKSHSQGEQTNGGGQTVSRRSHATQAPSLRRASGPADFLEGRTLSVVDHGTILNIEAVKNLVEKHSEDLRVARRNDRIYNTYLSELSERPSCGANFILNNRPNKWRELCSLAPKNKFAMPLIPHESSDFNKKVYERMLWTADMAAHAANLATLDKFEVDPIEHVMEENTEPVEDKTRNMNTQVELDSFAKTSEKHPRAPDRGVSELRAFFRGVPKAFQKGHPSTTPMPQEEIDGVARYYWRLHSAESFAEEGVDQFEEIMRSRHFTSLDEEMQVKLYSQQVTEEVNDTFSAISDYMEESMDEFELRPMGHHGIKRFQRIWFNRVVPLIAQEQEDIQNRIPGVDRRTYGMYFNVLPPEMLGAIAVQTVLSALLTEDQNRIRFTKICMSLGKAIHTQIRLSGIRISNKEKEKWAQLSAGTTPHQLAELNDVDKVLLSHNRKVEQHEKLKGEKTGSVDKNPHLASRLGNMVKHRSGDKKIIQSIIDGSQPWDDVIYIKVGAALLSRLTQATRVENPEQQGHWESAIIHELVREQKSAVNGRSVTPGYLRLHDWVIDSVLRVPSKAPISHAALNPMRVPPVDWTTPWNGGYLMLSTNLIRQREKKQAAYLNDAAAQDHYKIYGGVNAIQKVAWKLNNKIFDIQEEAYNRNISVGSLPSQNKIPLAPPSLTNTPRSRNTLRNYDKSLLSGVLNKQDCKDALEFSFRLLSLEKGDKEGDIWKKAKDAHREYAQKMHQWHSEAQSLMTIHQSKLDIGKKHYHDKGFYFPYSLDFRGRAYPTVPTFNHLGRDDMRCLLEFAEKKPLGPRGFRWLKIHLANLMGYDKASFDDREKFTEENMHLLRDSAQKPLDGEMWWLDGDNPWQALAVMIEIDKILDANEKDGVNFEDFKSGIPVHQDGSCNGLQHYAALGRDINGAAAVNLIATDNGLPADVYSRICEVVVERINSDAELHKHPNGAYGCELTGPDHSDGPYGVDKSKFSNEDEYEKMVEKQKVVYLEEITTLKRRSELARVLKGHVDRKTVKQTVMTSVYGVTRRGARDQVRRRIADKVETGQLTELVEMARGDYVRQKELQSKAADYVASLTLDSIGTVFKEAQSIMDWLAAIASVIAEEGEPVQWMTPIGFPVIQPYRKHNRRSLKTCMQNVLVAATSGSLAVDKQRQRSAFPPNFVHSLDATHMLMTAKTCDINKIDFAAVHDSYWTQAGSVDDMNEILRDEFVNLYTDTNILEDFAESLSVLYPGVEFPPLPERGDLDLNVVKTSPFFFS